MFGFREHEVGRFTLKKWFSMYEEYQKYHNFKVKGYIFKEKTIFESNDGWLPF